MMVIESTRTLEAWPGFEPGGALWRSNTRHARRERFERLAMKKVYAVIVTFSRSAPCTKPGYECMRARAFALSRGKGSSRRRKVDLIGRHSQPPAHCAWSSPIPAWVEIR